MASGIRVKSTTALPPSQAVLVLCCAAGDRESSTGDALHTRKAS